MKKLVKTLLVCGFATVLAVTTVSAQPFHVTADETGNLLVTDTPVTDIVFSGTALTSLATDPFSGVEGLHYELGPLLDQLQPGLASVAGDIVLYDGAIPSDIIRIVNAGGSRGFFFFSLLGEGDDIGGPQVADVDQATFDAIFATLGANGNVLNFQEGVNGAGAKGLFGYQPVSGPGTIAIAPGAVIYNFISDPAPVPEPSTLALFGLAGGMLLFWRQRSARA